jgi:hypothetical protein
MTDKVSVLTKAGTVMKHPAVWVLTVALMGFFAVYLVGLNPSVIQAQGDLAGKSVALWSAKSAYYAQLPNILFSATVLTVGTTLGLGLLALLISISLSMVSSAVSHSITKVVGHGIGYLNESPKGTTRLYLAQPSTVVSAHLNRLTERAGNSNPVIVDGSTREPATGSAPSNAGQSSVSVGGNTHSTSASNISTNSQRINSNPDPVYTSLNTNRTTAVGSGNGGSTINR